MDLAQGVVCFPLSHSEEPITAILQPLNVSITHPCKFYALQRTWQQSKTILWLCVWTQYHSPFVVFTLYHPHRYSLTPQLKATFPFKTRLSSRTLPHATICFRIPEQRHVSPFSPQRPQGFLTFGKNPALFLFPTIRLKRSPNLFCSPPPLCSSAVPHDESKDIEFTKLVSHGDTSDDKGSSGLMW